MRNRPALLRLLASAIAGIATGWLAPAAWGWETRAILGWDVFCLVNLVIVAVRFWNADAVRTRRYAEADDESRAGARLMTTAAAIVSLVGDVFLMVKAHQGQQSDLGLVGLAVATVALSWLVVQVEYALHYADQFYADGYGIIFRDHGRDEPVTDPDFRDFLYVALTVGMSYAISDTDLNSRRMRRRVTGHALLSYVFGSAIIAVTINAVASFLG